MAARKIGLIFHGIGTPCRMLEPGEAPYWLSVTQFENVLDRIAAHDRPDQFRISFDDSNLSDHDIALPHLVKRGLRADFFVLSGRVGFAGSLSAGHIRALQDAGMAIGSHGVAHRNWRELGDPDLTTELSDSRAALEAICDRPVTQAGIPFGGYDARVLRKLRQAGYDAAYTSDRGWMKPDAFVRPRSSVTGAMGPAQIDAVLSGHMTPLLGLRRALSMLRRRIG